LWWDAPWNLCSASFPPLRPEQAVAISAQVLDAIEHAHSYGILHRDIKPANIMLTAAGQAKVTDFGIARVLGTARMTREGLVCGTLQYLAPERIRGQEADLRSDLYSMGVVLYEILSHHLPFERASEYELMRAHLEEAPPTFASLGLFSVPPRLEMAVARALAKSPEQRFGSAREFRAALTAAANVAPEPPVAAEPPAPIARETAAAPATGSPVTAAPAVMAPGSRRKLYAGVAALLIAVGLIIIFLWTRRGPPAEAGKSPPAPVEAQRDQPAERMPAAAQPAFSPPSSGPPQAAEPGNGSTTSPATREQAPASAANAPKPQPTAKGTSAAERRKAALQALDKEASAKGAAKKGNDRKSSSLKALNN
jgi:hypothetical protein